MKIKTSLFVLVCLLMNVSEISCQSTYSKYYIHGNIISPDTGSTFLGLQILPDAHQVILSNDYRLTSDGLFRSSSLVEYDENGNVTESHRIASNKPGGFNSLHRFGEEYIVVQNPTRDDSGNISFSIQKFSNNLSRVDSVHIELDSITFLQIINNAIYEDRIYVTGISQINGREQDFGTILQIDARTLTLNKAIFLDRGALKNECTTVVEQSNGSIVTTNKYRGTGFGVGLDKGVQVVKLSPEGTILDTFDFREGNTAQRLGITATDDIIFPTREMIVSEFNVGQRDWLNKLDGDSLNNIIWGTQLPQDIMRSRRVYVARDVFTAANGDVILSGQTQDWENTEENCFDRHGFLARFTNDGEPLWVRVYRVPKPDDQGGTERCSRSQLNLVRESASGGLVAVGTTFNENFDFGEPSITVESGWLLSVDANGCLDGYSCQGLITLSEGVDTTRPSIFSPDYEWTQETTTPVLGFDNRTLRYRFSQASERFDEYFYYQFRVSDQPTGTDNFTEVDAYLREFEDRVYAYVEELQGPGMEAEFDAGVPVYDFSLVAGDTFRTVLALHPDFTADRLDDFRVAYAVTDRDSVTLLNGERRRRWQLVTVGRPTETHTWIEGLGDTRGLRVPVGDPARLTCHSLYGEVLYRGVGEEEPCWVEQPLLAAAPPLVDTLSEWWQITGLDFFATTHDGTHRFRFARDTTLLAGRGYRALEISAEQFGTDDSFQTWKDGIYFRQEAGVVYRYVPPTHSQHPEIITYDFTLVVGDTLTLHFVDDQLPGLYTVTQVDSIVLENGDTRKRLLLETNQLECADEYTAWIEGIGDESYLGETSRTGCSTDPFFPEWLRCHYRAGELLYAKPDDALFQGCWQDSTVSTRYVDPLPELVVFPNPATTRLTLSGVTPATSQLFTLTGRAVARFGPVNELPLDGLPPGLYLLRLTTTDGRTGVRRVVIR